MLSLFDILMLHYPQLNFHVVTEYQNRFNHSRIVTMFSTGCPMPILKYMFAPELFFFWWTCACLYSELIFSEGHCVKVKISTQLWGLWWTLDVLGNGWNVWNHEGSGIVCVCLPCKEVKALVLTTTVCMQSKLTRTMFGEHFPFLIRGLATRP